MSKYKIGIVGGSGFVGFHIATYLSSFFDVKILDVKEPKNRLSGVTFEPCDIRSFERIRDVLNDVDLVIHTAIIQIPLINENKRLAYEVNFLGTANVCRAVDELPSVKGMILASSWHTVGESALTGVINEEFGYRPDKVEDRARLYALSKIAQESIVRFYDEMSEKIYGIIRMGTVLGDDMPEKTAANIFITRGLRNEPITPFKHSMYRPMLYVDIDDVCEVYKIFATKIITGEFRKTENSPSYNVVNVYYPEPIMILELAEIVRDVIIRCTNGKVRPNIEIIDQGKPLLFAKEDKDSIKVDVTKLMNLLGNRELISPMDSIDKIVRKRLTSEII